MNDRRSYGLSKSLILKGIQCPKALYLAKYPPDFELPPKPELEARYRSGIEVGHLAQQLFPGGTEVPYEGLSVAEQVARTRDLIAGGVEIIYEASFVFEGIFVKADILVRRGDGWEIHEVKMATGVKDVNHDDAAIQYYVLKGYGLDVARAFIVHIDKRYMRQGEIEVERLFTDEDVTDEVLARQAEMPRLIADLRAALQGEGEPAIDIGPQCTDPYECDYIPYCWRHIPEDSVFSLRGPGIDKFAFYRQGIVHLADLPLERLNAAQRFQVEATLRKRDHIDPDGIREFLAELWHPLCHLDFETFDPPIPSFDGTRPYQKIPFQYSLHIEPQEGIEPIHRDFLAAPGEDPRRELAEKLLAEIPQDACVLTYNQAFEKGVLRDLVERFPDLAEGLEQRIANIRDLMRPFKQRHIYRWTMRGSYSIKEVLPALVPELSYKGLAVADGQMAMLAWDELGRTEDPARAEGIRQALREYCRLDTLAMVKILAEVRRLAAGR